MKIIKHITSTSNAEIKEIIALGEAKNRRKQSLFVVEGIREFKRAIEKNYKVDKLYICSELVSENEINSFDNSISITTVSEAVYEKIGYRGSTEGVIGIFKSQKTNLESINLINNPLILVVESVEKPGNLGALLRTADGAGVNAVIVCDPNCDIYNPNCIRSSLGAVFSLQIAVCESIEAIKYLKNNKVNITTTYLFTENTYYSVNYNGSSAIVLGSEADGISQLWINNADNIVKIPMLGIADSLNVSVAGAVMLYEALRQRKNK